MNFRIFTSLLLIVFFNNVVNGQKNKILPKSLFNTSCDYSLKGCEILKYGQNMVNTTGSFVFNPIVNNYPCVNGNENTNYGCLYSSPNQTWMYFTVNEGSNLTFQFVSSTEQDVDAAIWGPFNDIDEDLCLLSENAPQTCDYDTGRPDLQLNGVTPGQKYLLLVTNFDNTLMDITVNQPVGGNVTYYYPKFVETRLVSCFPFDNNLIDSKNVNITSSQNIQFVNDQNGIPNSAAYLNGNQYILYNGIGLANESYTYSLWAKPDLLPYYGENQTLLSIGDTQVLMISNNANTNGPSIYFWGYNVKNLNTPFVSYPILNNDWLHITVVRTMSKLKIYLNGALKIEKIITDPPGYGVKRLLIGYRSFTDNFPFAGSINDLKLFKGALSDSEIFQLYSNLQSCVYLDKSCIPIYPISGDISGNKNISAGIGVKTIGLNQITGTSNIIYSSGGFIELNPGFVSQPASVFMAKIEGCLSN